MSKMKTHDGIFGLVDKDYSNYGSTMSYTKFSNVKSYISEMTNNDKKYELLDEIGEDFIQTYLRSKKINRIMKR